MHKKEHRKRKKQRARSRKHIMKAHRQLHIVKNGIAKILLPWVNYLFWTSWNGGRQKERKKNLLHLLKNRRKALMMSQQVCLRLGLRAMSQACLRVQISRNSHLLQVWIAAKSPWVLLPLRCTTKLYKILLKRRKKEPKAKMKMRQENITRTWGGPRFLRNFSVVFWWN